MESLSETPWDVVIEGTGLRQSFLALALSRSDKKILHVDENEYYGGAEAAFSLQEVDEWVEKLARDSPDDHFRNVSLWKAETSSDTEKLALSRAYTLTLSPQIIYTKSNLLGRLVASKVYRQLEFQAVGNWWIYNAEKDAKATLKRLPNGREDIFEDKSIDLRAKRSLMKFLKFVVDYENQAETWESHAESSFPSFLSSQFKLPTHLQTVIFALTLSLDTPEQTTVAYALPRVRRHLTSIGVFGPGFGAVVPKWGGGAEIAQVACRACAVGGGVYVLGTGISSSKTESDNSTQVTLSNEEVVKTQVLSAETRMNGTLNAGQSPRAVSRNIAVVSSPLSSLFKISVEGAPPAAVSVVVFPPGTLTTDNLEQSHPIYIMVHSSETGECPAGQCVLYVTALHSSSSKALLEAAVATFIETTEGGTSKLLYSLYYEQQQQATTGTADTLDLAFNDGILDDVEKEWKNIMGDQANAGFMQFEDRAGMNEDEDEDNDNDEL